MRRLLSTPFSTTETGLPGLLQDRIVDSRPAAFLATPICVGSSTISIQSGRMRDPIFVSSSPGIELTLRPGSARGLRRRADYRPSSGREAARRAGLEQSRPGKRFAQRALGPTREHFRPPRRAPCSSPLQMGISRVPVPGKCGVPHEHSVPRLSFGARDTETRGHRHSGSRCLRCSAGR